MNVHNVFLVYTFMNDYTKKTPFKIAIINNVCWKQSFKLRAF